MSSTPAPKLYLNAALAGGGGYALLPEAAGDFSATGLTGVSGAWAVGGADFNSDGWVDVVVGAPGSDDKAPDAGRVYINLSGTGGTLGATGTEVIIDGVNAGDQSGAAVALISSQNADTLPDVLIGSPGLDLSGNEAGGAYLLYGSAVASGVDLADLQASGGSGFVIKGQAAGDRAGESLTSIASLNGDAKADIVIGAAGNDGGGADAGAAYVVWGKATTGPVSLGTVAAGTGGYRIMGENAGDHAGKAVAAVADLNGDGKQEVLVGAAGNDGGGSEAGAVYVVWGKATGTQVNLDTVALGTGGFKVMGTAGEGLGSSVAAAGDLNHDGLTDILAGTTAGDMAYVIFGKSTGASISTADLQAGIGGFAIVAEPGQSLAGMTLAGGVDLNRDGVPDLLIGAPHDSEGGTDAGAVYVVWGGGTGTVDLSLIAQGIGGTKIIGDAGSHTGSSVQIIADANGDGAPDLLIGSSGLGGEQVSVLYAPAEWQPGPEVYGTEGADLIGAGYGHPHAVGDQADNIFGYGGNDTILAGAGDDTIDGGTGNDSINAGDGNDTIDATQGVDTVHGDAGNDLIVLGDGDGTQGGSAFGDAGNDTLLGGNAADHLDGGDGNNLIQAGAGDDQLSAGSGADTLDGGTGADTLAGGAGDDTYLVDNLGDVVTDTAGNDTVVISADLLAAGWAGGTGIETISVQGTASVLLQGDAGANQLIAGGGNDTLDGGAGDDNEIGGEGNDVLVSHSGHDTLVGGTGNDTYQVGHGATAHIEDFQGDDTLDASESTADNIIDLESGHTSRVDDGVIDQGNGGSTSQSLDVQFLQDLTGSFGDDIATVQGLVPQIVSALQAVQANSEFGVSSFVDKGVAPFGDTGEWVYQQELGLTSNATLLSNTYNGLTIRYGMDEPEAQIESLMQLALHQTDVGFRDGSARFVILFTDAPFHQAGDGAAAGITTANNGDAVMDGGGLGEDYPYIAQVQAALEAANIIPIFAVANNYESTYQGLVDTMGRGAVVTLSADSSNVVAAIQAGLVQATTTLIENANGGAGNDQITGNQAGNRLDGGAGNDSLTGLAGDDSLTGGAGQDQIDGGDGSDTALYASLAEHYAVVLDAATGTAKVADLATGEIDTLSQVESLSFAGTTETVADAAAASAATVSAPPQVVAAVAEDAAPVSASALQGASSLLTGVALAVQFDPATLPEGVSYDAATHSFSLNPAAAVFQPLNAGETATVVVNYTLTDGFSSVASSTTFTVNGVNEGSLIVGTAGADALVGTAGNDTLDGGLGADTLSGSTGDDTYVVDNTLDSVKELTNQGHDLVQASVTYTLGSYVEDLLLTGHAAINGTGNSLNNLITGNDAANSLSGSSGNDTLIGGAGADKLNGGTGADSLVGGDGNDSYTVDSTGDVVVEDGSANGGADTISASISVSLGAWVENLTLTGSANLNGTGNDLANKLTGNTGANSLFGGAGNDSLNGSTGADWLDGGLGSDTYTVDNLSDVVVESAAGNVGDLDVVNSSVSFTLGAFLESLTLTGTLSVDGTGNDLANKLTGNAGANLLTGAGGNDVLVGNAGADTLIGGTGTDKLTGGADADRFVLTVGSGKDTITDFVHGQDHIDLTAFGLTDLSQLQFKDLGANTQITLASGESFVLNGVADFHVLTLDDFFL